VNWKERRLFIGNPHKGQRVKISIYGEYSEPGRIDRGVRQGCPLFPILFKIYIELIVHTRGIGGEVQGIRGGRKVDKKR